MSENLETLLCLNILIHVLTFFTIFLNDVLPEFFGGVCVIFVIRRIKSRLTRNLVQSVFSILVVGMSIFNLSNFTFVRWDELEGLKRGDMLQCSRNIMLNSNWFEPAYYHWAIYGGDGHVIHAVVMDHNLTAVIKFQHLEEAAAGFKCRVNNMETRAQRKGVRKRSDAEIVSCSYHKMLEDSLDYNVLTNNCEHFVTDCVYGTSFSSQTDFEEVKIYGLTIGVLHIIQMIGIKLWGDAFIDFVVNLVGKPVNLVNIIIQHDNLVRGVYVGLVCIWILLNGKEVTANYDKVAKYLLTFSLLEFSVVFLLGSAFLGTLVILIDNLEIFLSTNSILNVFG